MSKLFKLISVFALLFVSFATSYKAGAQNSSHCFTDEIWQKQLSLHPEMAKMKLHADSFGIAQKNTMFKAPDTTLRIVPVVFHIIHQYGKENISKQAILDQLKTLNECYRLRNSDTQSIRAIFQSYKADFHYQFVLATIDPNGKCTDGINRIYSDSTENANDNVKSLSWWDNTKYLNVWVVKSINIGAAKGETVLGYSQFPFQAANAPKTDGIIVIASSVGLGQHTLVHEIGHWLGLYHPFQDGCTGGDNVDDTPPVASASFGCPTTNNTCHNDAPDLPDMVENFMDYADCSHLFTHGQKTWIDAAMLNYRSTIYSASNLAATGADGKTTALKGCVPIPDFYSNTQQICQGANVQFVNNTYNSTQKTYSWSFNGGNPVSDTNVNPLVTFKNPGQYTVVLTAKNTNGSDSVVKTSFINVLPSVSTLKAPQTQGFESGSLKSINYLNPAENDGLKWNITTYSAATGTRSIFLNNLQATPQASYYFTLPAIDLSASTSSTLWFNCAFAQQDANSADELEVTASTDCGITFSTVFYKAGSRLATTTTYHSGSVFVPTANEWKKFVASLSGYSGSKSLILKFTLTNYGGNDIYIDDINLGVNTGIEEEEAGNTRISIYPNPATDFITLKLLSEKPTVASMKIFDMMGRNLFIKEGVQLPTGSFEMNLTKQEMNINTPGIYFLQIQTPGGTASNKIVIE